MKKIKKTILNILRDESGQGATEYILLLVVVVAIAMLFKEKIMGIVNDKLGAIGSSLQNFNP